MKNKFLGFLIFSAFYSACSAEAFLLPPFKIDAGTIGNEVISYANTLSQTAGKGVQQASIVQTGITYGQGAKEAFDFANKMMNDFKGLNFNKFGNIMGDISKKEAEQTKVKAKAAEEIAAKTKKTNAKIAELDENTRELNKKILEDPENAEKYQKKIRKNEEKKKKLSEDLIKDTRKITTDTDKKVGKLSDQIGELQGKASEVLSSITTIPSNYDSSADLQLTTETLMPGQDAEVDLHVTAAYAAIYRAAYYNTLTKGMGRVMLIKSRIAQDNEKAEKNKVSTAEFESASGAVGTVVSMKTDNIQALLNYTEILLQKMQLDIARDIAMGNFGLANPAQAAGDFNLDNYKFTPPSEEELEAAEPKEPEKLGKELDKEITPSSGAIISEGLKTAKAGENKEGTVTEAKDEKK